MSPRNVKSVSVILGAVIQTQELMTAAQPDRLDILIDQVGRLTEVVTVGFADLKELVREQAETSKRQEQNITRLVGIVENLLQREQQR